MLFIAIMYWPIIKSIISSGYINKYLYLNLSKNSEKTANNLVSSAPSISSILLNALYFLVRNTSVKETLIKSSYLTSLSYFTYDALLIAINKDTSNYPYIAHHLAGAVVLEDIYNSHNRDLLVYLYLLAEISNLPNFVVYHLLKYDTSHYKSSMLNMKYIRLFQVCWFSFFRIFVYSFYIKDCAYNIDHNVTKLLIAFLFLAGVAWSKGQIVGVYRLFNLKTIKQIN